eukprot:359247-Chlamydomonas_euryale.AAC.9
MLRATLQLTDLWREAQMITSHTPLAVGSSCRPPGCTLPQMLSAQEHLATALPCHTPYPLPPHIQSHPSL